jgi:ribonuclease Z
MNPITLSKYKGFTVEGYSRAAHRTGILIKGLDIILDAGLDVQKAFSHVFISHQHYDHLIYLPQYTFNVEKGHTINVISTNEILANIKPWLTSAIRMTKDINPKITMDSILSIASTKFIPLEFDSFYEFKNGSEEWRTELFKCYHSVDSFGFGFQVKKNKLKQEYMTLTQKEIKKIKNDGIEITCPVFENIFLFLGDTDRRIIHNEKIFEYPAIIMECTYIYDNEKSLAKKNKHIHWDDIKDIIQSKTSIQFILIHFSMKYSTIEIKEFFDKQKLKNLNFII